MRRLKKYETRYGEGKRLKGMPVVKIYITWHPGFFKMNIHGGGYKNGNILWALGRAVQFFLNCLDERD